MSKNFLDGKTILITGGTGSFGKNFIKQILHNTKVKKVIIFSRDELKQFQMQKEILDKRLRFFIGDVRDLSRLHMALATVDIVVHAAALKQVPIVEYNPFEAVKTNIIGSQNIIEAAIDQGVSKILLISTDKAAYPGNLYGSTKLCAEKLFVAANSYAGQKNRFSVVRYGNVIGSRGSFVESLLSKKEGEIIEITDPSMTRFWINLNQSYQLVMFALQEMEGGEIFVPKIPSMKITDVVEAIAPRARHKIIGIRPGEKLHEVLLTDEEAKHTVCFKNNFVIFPEFPFWSATRYKKYFKNGQKVKKDFCYSSQGNSEWLSPSMLKKLLK
ncbi:MAG: UDP-N-acetylglucosamine 4,6-dehydratase (inverting) [Patescibacteria group bacterium]